MTSVQKQAVLRLLAGTWKEAVAHKIKIYDTVLTPVLCGCLTAVLIWGGGGLAELLDRCNDECQDYRLVACEAV